MIIQNQPIHRDDCHMVVHGSEMCTCGALAYARLQNPPPTEMASLRKIKQRLAQLQTDFKTIAPLDPNAVADRLQAIEQGQGVLCERLDRMAKKLDAIQGALLLKQFQLGKPKRRRK